MSEQRPPPDDGAKPCAAPEAAAEAQATTEPTIEVSLDRLERTARERGVTIALTGRETRLAPCWHPTRLASLPPRRRTAVPPPTSRETPVFQYPRGALDDQSFTRGQETQVNRGIACLPAESQQSIRDSYLRRVDGRVLERRRSSRPSKNPWVELGDLGHRPWLVPVIEHLEALGYGLTENPQSGILRGLRPEGTSQFFVQPALLQVRLCIGLNEKSWSEVRGVLAMVNRMNEHFTVARAALDEDSDLVVLATHVGEYTPRAFQAFMDHWLADLRELATHAGDAWAYFNEPIRPPADTDSKKTDDEGEES